MCILYGRNCERITFLIILNNVVFIFVIICHYYKGDTSSEVHNLDVNLELICYFSRLNYATKHIRHVK